MRQSRTPRFWLWLTETWNPTLHDLVPTLLARLVRFSVILSEILGSFSDTNLCNQWIKRFECSRRAATLATLESIKIPCSVKAFGW